MKKNNYTEAQIAFALKQAELGTPISEMCRKLGIAEQTFYRWKSKYCRDAANKELCLSKNASDKEERCANGLLRVPSAQRCFISGTV